MGSSRVANWRYGALVSLLRAQRGLVNASVLPRVFQVQLPDEPHAAAPDGGASVDKTA